MKPTIKMIREYGDESYAYMDWAPDGYNAVFVLYLGDTEEDYDEEQAVPASFFAGTKIQPLDFDNAATFEYESEAEEALEYYVANTH